MAKLLKLRRGTTSQHSSFTGAEGEVTIDTTKDTAVVHDGSTQGGTPLAKENMSNVSSASIAGRLGTDSIAPSKIAAGTLPSDVVVNGNNIADGSILNADINASAAIANSKLANSGVTAASYGSSSAIPIVTVNAKGIVTGASTTAIDSTTIANGTSNVAVANNGNITATRSGTARLVVDNTGVDVTGNLTTTDNITITSTAPKIFLVDSDTNDDFSINGDGGTFRIKSETDAANRFVINSDGHVDIPGNLDCGNGIDVTGDIVATGDITAQGNDIRIQGSQPGLHLTDTNNDDDFLIYNNNGILKIYDATNGADRLAINSSGGTTITGNLDVGSGVDVTGNITCTGTIDGADVAAMNSKLSGIESNATQDMSANEILTAIKTVDGTGSGLDADTVDGYNVSTSDSTNTLVARNSSGYIFGNYLNMNGTFSNSPNTSGMSTFTGTNGSDNYGRSYSAAAARTLLNVANGATNNGSGSLSNYMPLAGGTFTGNVNGRTISPSSNNAYDLGSSSYRWRNIYTNDLHLSNVGHSNDVDGTWGDWTIQEGESDLFLKNNRSGKKYKFNLTEVS